ncbi:MAG TPA: hypothetical protein VFM72_09070 [Aequorivita sp.]|nr:hypothetical protein [Aequorivita sp.]
MKKLVFTGNLIKGLLFLFIAANLYSCKKGDDDNGNSFTCENYWGRVDLNSICNLGFPASFTFDSPPQAGATTICIANVLQNSEPDYTGLILITKTPSNESAITAYEAKLSGISPQNDIEDFDAGGERGFIVKIAGTERYDYTAVKESFLIQYDASVEPDTNPCLTKVNHDAYMRLIVAEL